MPHCTAKISCVSGTQLRGTCRCSLGTVLSVVDSVLGYVLGCGRLQLHFPAFALRMYVVLVLPRQTCVWHTTDFAIQPSNTERKHQNARPISTVYCSRETRLDVRYRLSCHGLFTRRNHTGEA